MNFALSPLWGVYRSRPGERPTLLLHHGMPLVFDVHAEAQADADAHEAEHPGYDLSVRRYREGDEVRAQLAAATLDAETP